MTIFRRTIFHFLACMVLATGAVHASPFVPVDFTTGTNTFSLTLGGGSVEFGDFGVVGSSGNPTPIVSLFGYEEEPGRVELNFNPNMSAPPSTGYQDLHFFFSVTGLNGTIMTGVDLTVGGKHATIMEALCSTAVGPGNNICPNDDVLGSMIAYSAPPGPNGDAMTLETSASKFWVMKNINVAPGGGLTEFNQGFGYHQPIPEPGTYALFLSGLGAFALYRRHKNRVS